MHNGRTMTSQELEIWARNIVDAALSGQPIEDSSIELKSEWLEPEKAARRLAAHANAAGGSPILWIVGVDESSRTLTDPAPTERANWIAGIGSFFDGHPPTLVRDVNMIIQEKSVVALHFETEHGAPYVVKHVTGGSYPERVVPWREGTRTRAARRHELLRILVPKRSLADLEAELEFNLAAPRAGSSKTLFRQQAFEKAMSDGSINSLETDLKDKIISAYVGIDRSNRIVDAAMRMPPLQDLYPGFSESQAQQAVKDAIPSIEAAHKALVTRSP
jgi:hypothetical protein